MSTIVVMPPAAAAALAVAKPSQLGAPRLVDVDVGVDEAGKEDGSGAEVGRSEVGRPFPGHIDERMK